MVSIDPRDKHGVVVPSSVGLVSKVVGRAFARTRQLCGHSIKPMSFHACELTILVREGVWGLYKTRLLPAHILCVKTI